MKYRVHATWWSECPSQLCSWSSPQCWNANWRCRVSHAAGRADGDWLLCAFRPTESFLCCHCLSPLRDNVKKLCRRGIPWKRNIAICLSDVGRQVCSANLKVFEWDFWLVPMSATKTFCTFPHAQQANWFWWYLMLSLLPPKHYKLII